MGKILFVCKHQQGNTTVVLQHMLFVIKICTYILLLGFYWLYKKLPANKSVNSHGVESFEGVLKRFRRGRVAVDCEKNTIPEHPVHVQT